MTRRYKNSGRKFSPAQKASYYAGLKAGKKIAAKGKFKSYQKSGRWKKW